MTIDKLIERLQDLKKNVPGDTELKWHEEHDVIECGDFIFKLRNNRIKNMPYCCYRCKHDKRMLSKDGKHRLCGRLCAEVTIEECKKILNNTL